MIYCTMGVGYGVWGGTVAAHTDRHTVYSSVTKKVFELPPNGGGVSPTTTATHEVSGVLYTVTDDACSYLSHTGACPALYQILTDCTPLSAKCSISRDTKTRLRSPAVKSRWRLFWGDHVS